MQYDPFVCGRFCVLYVVDSVDHEAHVSQVASFLRRVHLVLSNGRGGGVANVRGEVSNRYGALLPITKVGASCVAKDKDRRVLLS